MKKIILYLIVLYLLIPFVIAYAEPFKAEFNPSNLSDCKISLNIASLDDNIEIAMPQDYYCYDLSLNLRIGDSWCGTGGIPNLRFNTTLEGNQVVCITTLKQIYEDACWWDQQRMNMGEVTNKNWEIQFGWKNSPSSSYVTKMNFKILNNDDIVTRCNDSKRYVSGLTIGIPLLIVFVIFSVLAFLKRIKYNIIWGIIGILATTIITLLYILRIF